ncbi:MAG: hypothetical protein AB7N91_25035 [Candidatus Tectimicrobiota bacterium]
MSLDKIRSEHRRLQHGPLKGERSAGVGMVMFKVTLPDQIFPTFLEDVKEVLIKIDERTLQGTWPTDQEWRSLLPEWFLEKCKPAMTVEEANAYLVWWDSLSYEEKLRRAAVLEPWDLSAWISCFEPCEREWYWWNAVFEQTGLLITLEVHSHPFPSEEFLWLCIAAGAEKVEEIHVTEYR